MGMNELPALKTHELQSHDSHSAPSAPTPEGAAQASAPRPVGRPSRRTPELLAAIRGFIRDEGMSDSAAASLAGISATTLSRWKEDDEEFALGLERARAEFERVCLYEVREARKRDGSTDWRAYAWLLQNNSPEGFRRRSKKQSEDDGTPRVTLDQVERIVQARIREVLQLVMGSENAAAEKGEVLPEITEMQTVTTTSSIRSIEVSTTECRENSASLPEITEIPPDSSAAFSPASTKPTAPSISDSRREDCGILPKIPKTPAAPSLSRRERRAEERRAAKAGKLAPPQPKYV